MICMLLQKLTCLNNYTSIKYDYAQGVGYSAYQNFAMICLL